MAPPRRARHVLELPPDLLRSIAGHLGAADLHALSLASAICREVALDDLLWRALLHRQLRPILDAFFDGAAPHPAAGVSWRRHFFAFGVSWKRLAQRRSGRLLVQVATQQMERDERVFPAWGSLSIIRGTAESRVPTYGVHDVTDMADKHPGSRAVILQAASDRDATNLFKLLPHSDAAIKKLASLAVPGLEALPYDLEGRQGAARSSWRLDRDLVCAGAVGVAAVVASCSRRPSASWRWRASSSARPSGRWHMSPPSRAAAAASSCACR